LNLALLFGAGYYFHHFLELRRAYAGISAAVTVGAGKLERTSAVDQGPSTQSASNDTNAEAGSADAGETAVQGVVLLHVGEVRDCYAHQLTVTPSTAGTIELAFTIDGDGQAQDITVAQNTTGSADLATCIAQRLQGWPFPKTAASDVVFHYPFTLHAG
jgi:hypothetical protein